MLDLNVKLHINRCIYQTNHYDSKVHVLWGQKCKHENHFNNKLQKMKSIANGKCTQCRPKLIRLQGKCFLLKKHQEIQIKHAYL